MHHRPQPPIPASHEGEGEAAAGGIPLPAAARAFGSRLLAVDRRLLAAARGESGQTLTEYALILSFVVLLAIGALTIIGASVNDFLSGIAGQV